MINTFTGPMHSGKSEALISVYSKIYRKDLVMAFKPHKDTRDGSFIKSKSYEESIPAIQIEDLSEIKDHVRGKNIHTIFIDEIQMLEGSIRELVDLSVICDIDFYIAGLSLNGLQEVFGIMGDVLAASNTITILKGYCDECNKVADYSYFKGDEFTGKVMIGDELYGILCTSCLRKKLLQKHPEKMRLLK